MKQLTSFVIGVSMMTALGAQETLSLSEALGTALNNNHQINVLKYQQDLAENNVSWGNAGLLPTVSVGGSYGANVQNTDLEFAGNIPPVNVDGAQSSTLNANASVNYVLFSGLSGRRNYEKLGITKLAVDESSRAAIESTLLQVATAYYALVQADDQEDISLQRVKISERRYKRVKTAQQLGTALRTELLSAQVDLTTDSSAFLNAQLMRSQASRNLSLLLGLEPSSVLKPEDVQVELLDWTEEGLINEAMRNNAGLKNIELQKQLAEKDQQLSNASYFPTVSISGGYNYTNQQNEAGIILSNTAAGWNGNVGITYTLFNGFRNQTNRQNQSIILEQRSLELEQQKLQLRTQISNALEAYQQSIRVLAFEEANLEASELNLERSEALYNSGKITSTQFREAQLALSNAQLRISNAKISVKLNELELMRLSGQIMKEG